MKKENFLNKIIRKLKKLFSNSKISKTEGWYTPSATLKDNSQSYTKRDYSPSATLGIISESGTEGKCSHSATLGFLSINKTKGEHAHSATFEENSQSHTEGEKAFSVTMGKDSLCSTAGKDSIAVVLGSGSLVKAADGYIIIIEYDKKGNKKATHGAKVGDKILDVTIEPNKWYGFDDEFTFRMFTEEEVLEILETYYKNSRTILEKLKS